MTRDEFMELVYETFDGEPDNVLANGIIQAADDYAESMLPEPCVDAISRQAAIDALAKQMPTPYTPDGSHPADEGIFQVQEVYADCIETLELLPPAQPEERTEERTETHACVLISQQAAVELAMKYCPDDDGAVQCDGDIRELLDELEDLPPAQPEPERTMEEFMYGQDMGNPEDGSL